MFRSGTTTVARRFATQMASVSAVREVFSGVQPLFVDSQPERAEKPFCVMESVESHAPKHTQFLTAVVKNVHGVGQRQTVFDGPVSVYSISLENTRDHSLVSARLEIPTCDLNDVEVRFYL